MINAKSIFRTLSGSLAPIKTIAFHSPLGRRAQTQHTWCRERRLPFIDAPGDKARELSELFASINHHVIGLAGSILDKIIPDGCHRRSWIMCVFRLLSSLSAAEGPNWAKGSRARVSLYFVFTRRRGGRQPAARAHGEVAKKRPDAVCARSYIILLGPLRATFKCPRT